MKLWKRSWCGHLQRDLELVDDLVRGGQTGRCRDRAAPGGWTRRPPCRRTPPRRGCRRAGGRPRRHRGETVAPLAKRDQRRGEVVHVEGRRDAVGKTPAAFAEAAGCRISCRSRRRRRPARNCSSCRGRDRACARRCRRGSRRRRLPGCRTRCRASECRCGASSRPWRGRYRPARLARRAA